MGRSERTKGQRGELEVAAIFQAAGFDCDRTPNSGGLRITGDLYGDLPCHVEVKRQERLQLPAWLRQAAHDAPEGVMPLVAFRQNHGEWFAALPLTALVDLLAAAGSTSRKAVGDDAWPRVAILALALRAEKEPLGVDVSDYSDEWCAGFLEGQAHALCVLSNKSLLGAS